MGGRRAKFGKAIIEMSLLDDPVIKGIKRLQARLDRFGSSLLSLGATGLKVTAALAAGFALPLKAASDLQETMNKFNVVFGDNSMAAKEWADDFAGQVGRGEKQIADSSPVLKTCLYLLALSPAQQRSYRNKSLGFRLILHRSTT